MALPNCLPYLPNVPRTLEQLMFCVLYTYTHTTVAQEHAYCNVALTDVCSRQLGQSSYTRFRFTYSILRSTYR